MIAELSCQRRVFDVEAPRPVCKPAGPPPPGALRAEETSNLISLTGSPPLKLGTMRVARDIAISED
jgi:hypothetical protein